MRTDELELAVGESGTVVGAEYTAPAAAQIVYVFAHGAGANMRHPFMRGMAGRLAEAGIATLRYNFPYMQAGSRRPDPAAFLQATVAAAIEKAAGLAAGRKLVAGGKSMGGRMTSQLLASAHDPRVRGIAFFGFPLHQPGKPAVERAAHLRDVRVPMLFLQGTRDTLARLDLITEVCGTLGRNATLHFLDEADHSFAVPKRTGKTVEDIQAELARVFAEWAARL